MPRVVLEAAVQTLAEARAAREAGADRLELCHSLDQHGLTPDPALVRPAAAHAPTLAMIRPRPGHFVLTPQDLEASLAQARELLAAGATGIVFGPLTPDGHVDQHAARQLVACARNAHAVFHRAFDLIEDSARALESLIDAGVTRLLTAGQSPAHAAAALGFAPAPPSPEPPHARAERLAALLRQSRGRIEIIACGGIRAANARTFLDAGCRQIHAACRGPAGLLAHELADLRRTLDQATM